MLISHILPQEVTPTGSPPAHRSGQRPGLSHLGVGSGVGFDAAGELGRCGEGDAGGGREK